MKNGIVGVMCHLVSMSGRICILRTGGRKPFEEVARANSLCSAFIRAVIDHTNAYSMTN